ncbi:hypothetical protein LCGC14_1863960 [marine sediment metagenome]|uniref:Uncharacterized protein n=1 Tax=marine sediment metagenome TaxID=412755 RepID=A0A0F9G6Q3_9ZZZZ
MSKMGEEYNKRLEKYAPELLATLKGLLLTATPLKHSVCEFEKKYVGMFAVPGNRLERAVGAIAKVEGKL